MNKSRYESLKTQKNLRFEEFFDQSVKHHTEWMMFIKKPVFKFFLLTYKMSESLIRVHVFMTTPEGHSPLDFAKPIIEQVDPDYYVVLSEAWARLFKNQQEAREFANKEYQYGDIEKSSDRVEMLVASGKSKDGKNEKSKVFTLKRNEQGDIIELAVLKHDKMESTKLP